MPSSKKSIPRAFEELLRRGMLRGMAVRYRTAAAARGFPRRSALALLLMAIACSTHRSASAPPTLEVFSGGVDVAAQRLAEALAGLRPEADVVAADFSAAAGAAPELRRRGDIVIAESSAGSARPPVATLAAFAGQLQSDMWGGEAPAPPRRLQARCRIAAVTVGRGARTARAQVRLWLEAESTAGGRASWEGMLACELTRSAAGTDAGPEWRFARIAAVHAVTARAASPLLREEGRERGLDRKHVPLENARRGHAVPGAHCPPGVVAADLDGDGDPDLAQTSTGALLVFENEGGRFRDRSADVALQHEGDARGIAAADADGDGRTDLLVTYDAAPNALFRNLGEFRFEDVAAEAGLADAGAATSSVFFDADGDGWLDLYVVHYGDMKAGGPDLGARNGVPNRFYRNTGGGRFRDETARAGVGDTGWGLAAAAADYDGDGDQDLYVANDFGVNVLYRNRGDGTFVDATRTSGLRDPGFGMGVTWGDYDRDGDLDLYVSNYWFDYRWAFRDRRFPLPPIPGAELLRPLVARKLHAMCRGNSLFANRGDGSFVRVSDESRTADGAWAWGAEWLDVDGDGWSDLVVANGMFSGRSRRDRELDFWTMMSSRYQDVERGAAAFDIGDDSLNGYQQKRLFLNLGDGRFAEVSFVAGFESEADGRGLAVADYDGDGAPDVLMSAYGGRPLLFVNRVAERRWVSVRLAQPERGNRPGVGARVTLAAAGSRQAAELHGGSNFLSQNDAQLFFGLPASATTAELSVRWPGRREVSPARTVRRGESVLVERR